MKTTVKTTGRPRKKPLGRPRNLHPEIRALLDDIDRYCQRRGLTRTNFGLALANDGHFITRLERGRMATLRTVDRVRNFIDAR